MDFPHFFHRLSASHCDPTSRMMMIKLTTFMNIFLRVQIYITQLLSLFSDKTVVLGQKTSIIVKGGGRGGGGCPTGKIFPKMPLVLGPFAECIYLLCVPCSYLYRIYAAYPWCILLICITCSSCWEEACGRQENSRRAQFGQQLWGSEYFCSGIFLF